MLGNPNADNPFATSDPFGPSRNEPLSDDFDNVDIGNNAAPTSSGLYSGPTSDHTDAFVPAVPQKKAKANRTTKDLEKRERELDKREKALAAREAKLTQSGTRGVGTDVSNKNWPRCKPLVRHHIGQDVPPGRQRLVRLGYLAWLLMFAGFCWNWLVVLIMFIAAHKKLSDWLFASLICGFGLPLSFFLWYFNLYKGAIRDTSFRWWWYFIWAFLQPILCGWIAIAPPVVGNWCAGGFTMINQFKDGHGAGYTFGIFCVINLGIWALAGFAGASATSLAMKNFRGRAQSLGGDVQMQAPAQAAPYQV
ncbi:Secretory carrier-associated membrane protein 5 [Trebouxia sp. C0010 RCD-2024]